MGERAVGDRPLKLPLEIEEIKAILPHRSPFLLVDRVIELEADRRIVAIKNVTINERYFIAGPGGVPTMPASILTEAMAQAGAVLILSKPENRSRLVYFMGIDRVRYRRPVVAGDVVFLEGVVLRLRARMGSLRGRALVDGKVACEGEMTFARLFCFLGDLEEVRNGIRDTRALGPFDLGQWFASKQGSSCSNERREWCIISTQPVICIDQVPAKGWRRISNT